MPMRASNVGGASSAGRVTRVRAAKIIRMLCWLYLAALVGLWVVLHTTADRWWLGTLAMYGPRWFWGVPLLVLIPAAAAVRRRSLWVLSAAVAVLVVPVMGFCVPGRRVFAGASAHPRLRVLTCNVDSSKLDAGSFAVLVGELRPDLVALQGASAKHARKIFTGSDWHVRCDGELCLASRYPISDTWVASSCDFSADCGALARYDLETPFGDLYFLNIHLASPRRGLQAVIDSGWGGAAEVRDNTRIRRRQSETVSRLAAGLPGGVLLAGDLNMPPDSSVYAEYWAQFENAFSSAGLGFGNTHFTRRTAVRVDHILAVRGWKPRHCWVGPDIGSAHRPLIADLERVDPCR
jgi:vancomycin resistance protein VanJ